MLSTTTAETAALWARHWERITGARKDQVVLQFSPKHKCSLHIKYITSPGQKMLQNASEIHCNLPQPDLFHL